jgi:hypothetical protein
VLLACGLGLGAVGPGALSCSASGLSGEAPVPAVGSSPDAGTEFEALLRTWSRGTPQQRRALDADLRTFQQRYPDDDLGRLARGLRALIALERNELARALALGTEAALGPPGTTQDLGNLVLGAVDRRRGQHRRALDRLIPLLHKLLDPSATALLDEELVRAALGAKDWQRAIAMMAVWLRETEGASRTAARAHIEELLGALAAPELLGALPRFAGPEASSPDEDMARLVAARLAELARAERDAKLARLLVDRFGGLLGRSGEDVARLAGSTTRARVTGKTIGLLLSLDRPELRRRTAEVAAGMAYGLGIPGSGARLVSRDARSSAEEIGAALTELSTDGAAVVVAGIDPTSAALAAEHARASSLPVILLSAPADAAAADCPFVFVLGEDPERTAQVLVAELRAADVKTIVGLGGPGSVPALPAGGAGGAAGAVRLSVPAEPAPPSTVRELGCGGDLDIAALRSAAADGLLVRDGAACGPEITAAARSLRARLAIGLGVPGLSGPLSGSAVVLSAGMFPVDPQQPPAELRAWLQAGRGVPSWWAALGRDAAVLGWSAVRDMGEAATEDPAEVVSRRAEAVRRLQAAREALWTTEAKGFAADRRMSRDIAVRSGSPGGGSRDAAR